MSLQLSPVSTLIFCFFVLFCNGVVTGAGAEQIQKSPAVYFPTPHKVELVQLQPNCGVTNEEGDDLRAQIPWNAAIYLRRRRRSSDSGTDAKNSAKNLRFVVTGTIVGPSTILAALGGAYGQNPRGSRGQFYVWPPDRLVVGVGLNTTNLNNLDTYAQISEVKYVLPFPSSTEMFPEFHYVILHLKTPLDFGTPFVKPVCLALQVLDGDVNSELGLFWLKKTSGFAYPPLPDGSFQLRQINVSSFPLPDCQGKYSQYYNGTPYRPYCAKKTKGSEDKLPGCILPGGRVTINGILGAILVLVQNAAQNQFCSSADTLYFFGGLLPSLRWLYNNLLCGPEGFACRDGSCVQFQNVCDGVPHCPADDTEIFNDENPTFCRAQNRCKKTKGAGPATHECGLGQKCIRPEQVCDGQVDCAQNGGSDEEPSICKTGQERNQLIESKLN